MALDHIKASLLDGKHKVGARLPPGRDLAKELSVSRGAVKETIRMLQVQRILESYPGPGHGTRIIAGHTAVLGRLSRLHLTLSSTSTFGLTNTRVALERSTATFAPRHWDDEALNKLGGLMDRVDQETTLDEFNVLDTDSHMEITLTVHNLFTGDLSSAIRRVMRTPVRDTSMTADDRQALRNILCKQHRQISEAIEKCNGDLAAVLMEKHIRTAYQILELRI